MATKQARLSFVVVAMEGTVSREYTTWTKGEGLQPKMVEEPAGFIVYFPKGHVLRFRTAAELKHYGLDKEPKFLDMEGMLDPNSAIGKLFMQQTDEDRAASWEMLEDQVIALATAKTGKIIMPEQVVKREDLNTDTVRAVRKSEKTRKRQPRVATVKEPA